VFLQSVVGCRFEVRGRITVGVGIGVGIGHTPR
jgi:hypothetical protein